VRSIRACANQTGKPDLGLSRIIAERGLNAGDPKLRRAMNKQVEWRLDTSGRTSGGRLKDEFVVA
jgi:hypothetical protein